MCPQTITNGNEVYCLVLHRFFQAIITAPAGGGDVVTIVNDPTPTTRDAIMNQ